MTKYPQDHYDDVPEYTDQVGAHRAAVAKPESNTGLNVLIIAAALVLVVGIVAFLLLPQLRNDWFGASAPTDEQTTEAPADPSDTDDADADVDADTDTEDPAGATEDTDATDDPADETGGTDETGETGTDENLDGGEDPNPTGAADVDYSQGIEVYNATMIEGLAGQAAQELTGAGFNVPVTSNWSGFNVTSSSVFYAEDEATAQAIADQLGIAAVHEPSFRAIVVVLAEDFAR